MKPETTQAPRRILVCEGSNCRRNGAPQLKAQLAQIFTQAEEVEIRRYLCFGACAAAPNIVVMPDRLWYSFVIPAYIETVAAAIQQGKDVPGLANHVRPDIRETVFTRLDER